MGIFGPFLSGVMRANLPKDFPQGLKAAMSLLSLRRE
jgi:hypothetical protein